MTTTIKRGTARRLGLRPPPIKGFLRFPKTISGEQIAEFIHRFESAVNGERWKVEILDGPPQIRSWLDLDRVESRRERRKRLGLRWWQRGGS
jgi:hypothetical protein